MLNSARRVAQLNGFDVVGAVTKPVTKAQLETEFAGIAALPEAEQPIVRIRGDGSQAYQNIIDLLSLAKSKGLTKVGLDSETR